MLYPNPGSSSSLEQKSIRRSGFHMGSKWRKAKLALGFNLCVYVPTTVGDDDSPPPSDAALLSPPVMSPAKSPHGLSFTRSSNKVCETLISICAWRFFLSFLTCERKIFRTLHCWCSSHWSLIFEPKSWQHTIADSQNLALAARIAHRWRCSNAFCI